jgi:RimJ/RimL family protein N-acetyltransferase
MPSPWIDTEPVLRAIDPHDDTEFRAWYDVMRAGATAGREAAKVVPREALNTSLRAPGVRWRRTAYGAFVGDTIVGTATLALPMRENPHLAEIDINVPPEHRCRGFGFALLGLVHAVASEDLRNTFLTEINVPAGWSVDDWPGSAFAMANGFRSEHQEDHLVLNLPCDQMEVERLRAAGARHHVDYELLTWTGPCPEELVDAFASLNNAMGEDVPTGNLDHTPPVWDADLVHSNDRSLAGRGYTSITTLARHVSGELAGYSLMFVSAHDRTAVSQDDTLVIRAHRGHRLGCALKLANLGVVAREFGDARTVHTWTAGLNGPMQHINEKFGFRKVEQMHQFQRVDQT